MIERRSVLILLMNLIGGLLGHVGVLSIARLLPNAEEALGVVSFGHRLRRLCAHGAWGLGGPRFVLLSLEYRGGVEDTRGNPAFPIIRRPEELGEEVTTFDPCVTHEASNLDSALSEKDCMVPVTNHPEFKQISDELLKERGVRVVVDGRNILDQGEN